jgi:hypothetical protein
VANGLVDLVAEARKTTDGQVGPALILVLHRLRERRPEDTRAHAELRALFVERSTSLVGGPPVAA